MASWASAPLVAAPSIPPRLNRPWQLVMMFCRLAASQLVAEAFIATLRKPSQRPRVSRRRKRSAAPVARLGITMPRQTRVTAAKLLRAGPSRCNRKPLPMVAR